MTICDYDGCMTTTATPARILTGTAAIEFAELHNLTLSKHADPTEDARNGLTIAEATQIVTEDPSLIFIDAAAPVSGRVDFECGFTLGDWKIDFPMTDTAEQTCRWEAADWNADTVADLKWISCALFDAEDNEVDFFRLTL